MLPQTNKTVTQSKPITALILDDEPDACKNLETLLRRHWNAAIEIVGIAQSTEKAEAIINQKKPQVIFIDIEMPEENAFHFLNRIERSSFEIIFVTAYDEYALRALKLNAIDYILKPISLDELEQAIKKLEERILLRMMTQSVLPEQNLTDLIGLFNGRKPIETITLRSKTETLILEFRDIIYIEAVGSYSNFHFEKNQTNCQILMSRPLSEYEELLPGNIFFRTHKSFIVNAKHVKRILKDENSQLELKTSTLLPLSRRRQQSFVEFLRNNL